MGNEAVTAALAEAADTLRDAARDHKRAEGQHRKRSRELMRKHEELRRVCAEHGIQLESTDPKEGPQP